MFDFEQDSLNGGVIRYGSFAYSFASESDEMSQDDADLWNWIAKTLNDNIDSCPV